VGLHVGAPGVVHGKRGTGTGTSTERSLCVFGQASGACGPHGASPTRAQGVDAGNGVLAPASKRECPSPSNPLEIMKNINGTF
jgi:hypothetical protein